MAVFMNLGYRVVIPMSIPALPYILTFPSGIRNLSERTSAGASRSTQRARALFLNVNYEKKELSRSGKALHSCLTTTDHFIIYPISARSRISFSESFHPRQGSVMDLPYTFSVTF
jgi:hypothetical protein